MGIADFLATAASNFRIHYLELAARNNTEIKSHSRLIDPGSTRSQIISPESATGSGPATDQVDRYVPSGIERDDLESPDQSNDSEHPENNDLEKLPDGTYSYRRESSLKIKLDLKFELGAITRTAQRLENGEITAIDSFTAAGFGLRASMHAEGRQVVESSVSGESDSSGSEFRLKERSSVSARSARQFGYQDDNFAMNAFSRESANIRRSLDVKVHDNHRRAVNKISMRFRLDSTFSFAQATRFNVQTNRVAEQTPEAVGQYLDTAGKVAASDASSDLLTGFFDAVDSYLDDSEQALLDNVTAFFDAAAEELGFSSGLVDVAREKLTQSITSFFDRVETALDSVASQFTSTSSVPDVQPPRESVTPLANIPAPTDFAEIETDQEKALLAVA